MNSVPVTFITSNRSTYSDVMSISNTARVKTQRKAKIASHRVRFPYDTQSAFKAMGAGIDEKHTTMLEKQQTAASRARKNRELHAEHDLFMERLTRERQARTKIEGEKAKVIQRYTRGFLVRPRGFFTMNLHETREAARLILNTKSNLTHDLLEMTEKVGLPPIPGMTMDSKKMIEQHRIEDELKHADDLAKASVQIQACIRQREAARHVRDLKKQKMDEKVLQCTIKLQRLWRGRLARNVYKTLMDAQQCKAITFIQNRIRIKRARLESEAIRKAKLFKKRRIAAAVVVQALMRGKLSRRTYVTSAEKDRRVIAHRNTIVKFDNIHRLEEKKGEEGEEDWLGMAKNGVILENVLSSNSLGQARAFKAEAEKKLMEM